MISMNAKHSLCTISLVAALLCIAGEIKAQSRYERVSGILFLYS